MSDSISRKGVSAWLDNMGYPKLADAVMDEDRFPTADNEAVRCKDCEHWHREIYNGIEYFNFSWCDLNHYGDGQNFYCADGSCREDGEA